MSLKDQLGKLDKFYSKETEKEHQPEPSAVYIDQDLIGNPSYSELKMNTALSPSNGLKVMAEDKQKMKKYKSEVKTKWDTFHPYAFCRLSTAHKDEHFLQLFDQFMSIKMKLNEEMDKNRKLQGRNVFLEKETFKAKKRSPDKDGSKPQHPRQVEDRNQTQQLKEEVKRLHEKIFALTGSRHMIGSARPHSAKPKAQKTIFPVTENIKAQLELSKKQINELILIIDELKSNKFSLQNQLKEKQSHEYVSKVGNRGPLGRSSLNNESQFQNYAFDLQKCKEKYNDLEIVFNKMSEDKDRIIRELQVENIDLRESERVRRMPNSMQKVNDLNQTHYEQRVADLQREKQSLQREVRRMVAMPFNQSNNNKSQVDLQEKATKLQLALVKLNAQHSKIKSERSKFLADLQFKTKENSSFKADNDKMKKQIKELLQKDVNPSDRKDIDYNDYYRKLMGLVKFQGEDPVWRKYSLLAEPSFSTMSQEQLLKTSQDIWKSKLELMAHLEKAHIELKTISQSTESRVGLYLRDKEQMEDELKAARARLDEWVSMEKVGAHRHVEIFEQNGIHYDDSTSVFEVDEQELKQLGQQQNYFDLFLGQLTLDEGTLMHNTQNKIKQVTQMISFVTIDFYNHDTQHSILMQGNARRLANNFSFKVDMNQHLVKFLAKQSVVIELWSPQGAATVLLGKGEVWLRDLVSNSVKDISAIVRGKCPIYHQNDRNPVATLEYRVRMRLPIASYCQLSPEDTNAGKVKEVFRLSQRKRLEVKIHRAINLPNSSPHFVHFTLQGDDYNTEPIRGSSPEWNYRKEIEVIVDENFEEQLKQRYFQFVIFDDQEEINDDVVGIAKADLTRMIETAQNMDLQLDIRDVDFQLRGKLKVEFKWI